MKYKVPIVGENTTYKFVWPHLLLHPNIPKPLHGLNPRTLLGEDWWNIVRQEAYKKNNYCCWACGNNKNNAKYYQRLEAHECYEIDYIKGTAEMKMISALCYLCHNYIHNGRLKNLLRQNKISQEFYDEVISHGANIVSTITNPFPEGLLFLLSTINNLYDLKSGMTSNAKWEDWKLLLNGKEYSPIHKTYEDWIKYYHE